MHFSKKLGSLLDRHRLSNKALAERLGIAHTTIGRWLDGSSFPQDRMKRRVAEELGVSEADLFDDKRSLPEPERLPAHALARFEIERQHALDAAAALRRKADELLEIAASLEEPFLRGGEYTAEEESIIREAEAKLAPPPPRPVQSPAKTQLGAGR